MLAAPYKERLEKIFISRKDPLSGLRAKAWERAWQLGAPELSEEAFKKISLKDLYRREFVEKRLELLDIAPYIRSEMYQITFINGRYCPHLSSVQEMKPCIVLPIEDAFLRYGIFLQNRIHNTLQSEASFFPLLTEALQESGLFIYLPPGTSLEKPIQLLQFYTGEKTYSFPRIQVTIGSGSKMHVEAEQIFLGTELMVNGFFDVVIEQDATFRMNELALAGENHMVMQHLRATLRKDSSLHHFFATTGSDCYRHDIGVQLLESGAKADLRGVWNVSGSNKAHTNVLIAHKAESAFSNQHYKGILQGKGSSTFEGKIYVAPEAQKTVSYQLNNNLILDKGAVAFTKPNLEIFADDVKASHGATIFEIDEEELFYLRARGLSTEQAKKMLTLGFLDALLKDTQSPHIQEAFNAL